MNKLLRLLVITNFILIGCSNLDEESINITSYGTNRNWEGHLEVKYGNKDKNNENVSEANLNLKYTGSKMDDVKDSTIKISLIDIKGDTVQEFDGLSSDGIIKIDLSEEGIAKLLEVYDPMAIHIFWYEGEKQLAESLQFDEDMAE